MTDIAKALQPHQQRVVQERHELNIKSDKLTEFLKGDIFPTLPFAERKRLERQLKIMGDYSDILAERICNF